MVPAEKLATLSFTDVKRRVIAKAALLLATLIPIALLVADSFTNAPSPYFPRYVISNTGDWGLRFLVLSLCVTPLRRLTGWHRVIQLRRTLGLAAFFYSGLHVLVWAYWDWSFQVASMAVHILTSAFLWTGAVALLLLLPLALTSNRVSMSWLGRRWRALHRLTYLAAMLTLGHFWLRGPFGVIDVRKWIVVLVILMGFRLVTARKRLGDRGAAQRGAAHLL
jgi:sulfoxide reductase heme-binding subunit YedZ